MGGSPVIHISIIMQCLLCTFVGNEVIFWDNFLGITELVGVISQLPLFNFCTSINFVCILNRLHILLLFGTNCVSY